MRLNDERRPVKGSGRLLNGLVRIVPSSSDSAGSSSPRRPSAAVRHLVTTTSARSRRVRPARRHATGVVVPGQGEEGLLNDVHTWTLHGDGHGTGDGADRVACSGRVLRGGGGGHCGSAQRVAPHGPSAPYPDGHLGNVDISMNRRVARLIPGPPGISTRSAQSTGRVSRSPDRSSGVFHAIHSRDDDGSRRHGATAASRSRIPMIRLRSSSSSKVRTILPLPLVFVRLTVTSVS